MPRRTLHLTEDLVARVHREVEDCGSHEELTPLTDADKAAAARHLLAQVDGPLWVFAYGSLIWKPAFDHVEAQRAIAHGWRRSFCLDINRWRANPDQPGLMLALDRGGACTGVAYRLPEDDPEARMVRLLDREVSYHEDLPSVRWLTVRGSGRAFRALAFYATPRTDPHGYYLRLPEADQAARLARAVGHIGSGAEYLRNTVHHLEELGIRDAYLWRLQRMVAEEIAALHPGDQQ